MNFCFSLITKMKVISEYNTLTEGLMWQSNLSSFVEQVLSFKASTGE
jgi:hypothetical protein